LGGSQGGTAEIGGNEEGTGPEEGRCQKGGGESDSASSGIRQGRSKLR
jgi:hypothetical protein